MCKNSYFTYCNSLHTLQLTFDECGFVCICYVSSELIQTELHHVRTLHIMERVFRQGMLEELQLDPNTVHSVFPCLDQLTSIHSYFLRQLLLRRHNSLQSGSSHNYTIHQLGDILLEQVTSKHSCFFTHTCTPREYLFQNIIKEK